MSARRPPIFKPFKRSSPAQGAQNPPKMPRPSSSHKNAFSGGMPGSSLSTPLTTHFSSVLAEKASSRSLASYRYRAPIPVLQDHINQVRRPSHYCEKWFADKTGSLSNDMHVKSIWPASYFSNMENTLNIPTLQHGLDGVISTGEVHVLQNFEEPSTSYFDMYLRDVAQPQDLQYNNMSSFRPPSRDDYLHKLARLSDCEFAASTSSMTGALSAFYLLISNFKAPYANSLPSFIHSKKFTHFTGTVLEKPRFLMLRPQKDFSVPDRELHLKEGVNEENKPKTVYAMDNDSMPFVPANLILTKLGHSLERALTYNPDEFRERFRLDAEQSQEYEDEADPYHYTKFGNFLVRSQLDCFDQNLKSGKGGIFDLKTRATAPIRFNMKQYDEYIGREQITNFVGETNSFEKEFYDMVRNALIKYSYQGLLGRMDGMFMAYHNTSEMYGFEYLPLEEINTYVFGSDFMARKGLLYAMQMVSKVCNLIVDRFPEKPVRMILRPFKNRDLKTCEIMVYAHVVGNDQGWKEVHNEVEIEEFYRNPNPFNIPDDVIGFRIGTHATKNGRPVHHDLHYRETDDLQVDYFIEELSNHSNALTLDVIRMMKMEVMSSAPGDAAIELARKLREVDRQTQLKEKPTKDNL